MAQGTQKGALHQPRGVVWGGRFTIHRDLCVRPAFLSHAQLQYCGLTVGEVLHRRKEIHTLSLGPTTLPNTRWEPYRYLVRC